MTVPESKWQEFCVISLVTGTKEFKALIQTDDPESEPYKSRYAAAEGQQKLIDAIRTFEEHQDHLYFDAEGVYLTYHTILGRVLIRRGLALAETDLTQDCQECLKAGLQHLKRTQPCQDMYSMLVALNSLGILLCNLSQLKESSACLTEAECAYHAIKDGTTSTEGSQKLLHLEQDNETDANDFCEELYTKTLFFSAQVHQNLGNVQKATEYCGATLQRQAAAYAAGKEWMDFTFDDWIKNAASLAFVYINDMSFAEGHQLLNAASAMLEMAQSRPDVKIDEETRPIVTIAWARYYLARLDSSIAVRESGIPDAPAELPAFVNFPVLDLPAADTLPWGRRGFAASFEQARSLFNASMPKLREALEFYKLDGSLAMFEQEPHRACVMHRQRLKQFTSVEGDQLNYQHYEGLVKSIALEVSNASKHIWTIKEANKWPRAKVDAANRDASFRVSRFLNLFSKDGQLPEKIEDAWETHVLTACTTHARLMLQRLEADEKAKLVRIEGLLKYAIEYTKRHSVAGFEETGILAEQMHELITQQLDAVCKM